MRQYAHPAMAVTQAMSVVDTAQPGPPRAGMPRCPYMNTRLSGTFSARPARFSTMITRGRETAVLKE